MILALTFFYTSNSSLFPCASVRDNIRAYGFHNVDNHTEPNFFPVETVTVSIEDWPIPIFKYNDVNKYQCNNHNNNMSNLRYRSGLLE